MLVQEYMSTPAVTIHTDTGVQEALRMMRTHRIRRIPVVDEEKRLVGIVSERDLLYASPSPATSLSVWEMNYLLAKLKVSEVMARHVLTTTPDAPLQSAARLMLNHKIGGLPVVDGYNHVVGVITESDIFRAFLDQEERPISTDRLVAAAMGK
ncbi:MAG: CBS domain-containing protein [Caldilineaceae bacterium]